MRFHTGQSNPVLLVTILACVLAMGVFHKLSHPPALPAPVASAAPPQAPVNPPVAPASVAPASVAAVAPASEPPAPTPAPPTRAAQPPPSAPASPAGPPLPVYVGMVNVQGRQMALIQGLPGASSVGEPIGNGGVIERIEPLKLHVRYPTGLREVPLDVGTERYLPPAVAAARAAVGGAPGKLPPLPPPRIESGPAFFVPVAPPTSGPNAMPSLCPSHR